MKQYIFKTGFILVAAILLISCQGLKFGDASLAKPPAGDVTIDEIYSNADYARRALTAAYNTLPWGINLTGSRKLGCDVLECLTDLNHSHLGWGGCGSTLYYAGTVTAVTENGSDGTKYSYVGRNGDDAWLGIRRSYLFINNVDVVPDLSAAEKTRMKAEAKMIIAIHYMELFRHFGGVPWIDHAYTPTEPTDKERETALQTVENIVALLDEAAKDLPWVEPDPVNWDGRMTKAGAMGLKARLLLFAASPLFNSAAPYMPGEAADKHLTWFGKYMPELWTRALKAHEDFFDEMARNGGYALVTQGANYREVYRNSYFNRNNGECLISHRTRFNVAPGFWDGNYYWMQSAGDYGTTGPTQEWVDMYPMVSGKSIFEDPDYNPQYPYRNRDPRLYENIIVNGDVYNTTRVAAVWINQNDPGNITRGLHNQKQAAYGPFKTGYRLRKFLLDGGGGPTYDGAQLPGRVVHWPYLRLPELYLGYAELLCQTGGNMNKAYEMVNALRSRVGVGGLKPGLTGNDFIEAVLTERCIELAFEEVRWFDMIRYKREDIFKKRLHWVEISIKPGVANPAASVTFNDDYQFNFEYLPLSQRYWAREFSPKWYLSAFPSNEINKRYGLIQNPGW